MLTRKGENIVISITYGQELDPGDYVVTTIIAHR